MKLKHLTIFLLTFLLTLLTACSLLPSGVEQTSESPPALSEQPTLTPFAELTIIVTAPEGTPPDAELVLEILDEVSGWPYNSELVPMTPSEGGRWEAHIRPLAGSLLRYRYRRESPGPVIEAGANGIPIRNRMVFVPASAQMQDMITAWEDAPYLGPTGNIIGRFVDAETGNPLPEIIANVAGQTAFTDSKGNFRFDELAPGLHTVVAFHPTGRYSPAQQGAIIAPGSITPVQMSLHPAEKVQLTFQVTVPEDTLAGTPLRMAGNLQQFGHLFTELPGGITNSVDAMPLPIEVDATHYIQIIDFYAGTDFRYRYTLGDGLLNVEHDNQGLPVTRQVIIPNEDTVIRDRVAQWKSQEVGEVSFWVSVPSETPPGDQISLQLNPSSWLPPIPMWHAGENEWFYALHNQPSQSGPIFYRYCRNQQCGSADDAVTAGKDPNARQYDPSQPDQDLRDAVQQWSWLQEYAPNVSSPSPQTGPHSDFLLGFEIIPRYQPSWEPYYDQGFHEIVETGANSIILTPSWSATSNDPVPVIGFDPALSPYRETLASRIHDAQQLGLEVAFHPSLRFPEDDSAAWWASGRRDDNWWSVWFERYSAFIISCADQAEENGVTKIIIGTPEVSPALPEGQLANGSPSGVPDNATSQWRDLISEVRTIYSGKIAFELEFSEELQRLPPLLSAVDEIHVYWHSPLASTAYVDAAELQEAAATQISDLISRLQPFDLPIVLSVEYPSVDGGATDCPLSMEGECIAAEDFDLGAVVNPYLNVNMEEQALAISAVLAEAAPRQEVGGFYVRRYFPVVPLQDKSASSNGKLAMDFLKIWYSQPTED